ncbi:hypothetical protein [Polyangium jinanense]|uniref:Uncharacterized protein n=1 Tax=Polyangium jinanense TaxID=2829994 RepID=A0A9X3X6T3_9BACT|nr:hypothetical protein [Polyangium jinanense]MDC3956305.1 hypothetical protein [Polyangium jinanense]MDC3982441.1 hypothetical protein [Polyangium jinanense]
MVILVVWALTLGTALAGSAYTTLERRSIRDTAGALWITAVGPVLGAGLMGKYLVLSIVGDPARHKLSADYDIFIGMAALLGVLLGPLGFVEGLRHAHPLHVPAHVNVTRGLFFAAWTISACQTAFLAFYA